ncbi:MAG: DEAD/DEAH box helicase family protein [Phycisphaeraceae bacterium]|nr:DEAD/DEAH box helicase family protein [Phycisphaeraceae bacterium]MCB9848773.1 DEAD/DEAH box helicase family protein [Phycisphaeraceae bacterium]
MELRPYQTEAVSAVYDHLRERDDNPCVVIPTGGGKTPVIATICRDAVELWDGRVVILAHVKELLEQAVEKIAAIAPGLPIGIYSAGLGRKDLGYAVTVAGIQSLWKKACDLGPVDLIIVDEAHMVPAEDDGMYRRFIADARVVNPSVRIVGLTATPYRMKSGEICGPGNILNHVCSVVGVRELIARGYLSPLRTRAGSARADTSALRVRAGEFVAGEVEDLMDTEALVESACEEIVGLTADRKATLIFSSGVRHGRHIARTLQDRHGAECGFVCGETSSDERSEILGRFRSGGLQYLCNVNVLTTGFDAPHIDCVALVRPTMSPGLYYQMVGRGFRMSPGKADCLVLDFGGNVLRHGPVDAVRVSTFDRGDGEAPAKECPECRALILAGYSACPECGYEFPEPERRRHEARATTEGILSGQTTCEEHRVSGTTYHVHYKRSDPSAPPTMRVEYRVGFSAYFREWVCFEHEGYALAKASQWWLARSNEPFPSSVEEAVELALLGALAETESITVERKAGEQFDRIIAHRLGAKPPRLDSDEGLPEYTPATSCGIPLSEIPF